jgi:hypothetical protein
MRIFLLKNILNTNYINVQILHLLKQYQIIINFQ